MSHIFIVHSGISEILASRIVSFLMKIKVSHARILILYLRNQRPTLLSDFTYLRLDQVNHVQAAKYIDFMDSLYEHLQLSLGLNKLLNNLGISNFFLYTPHTKLAVSMALISISRCAGIYITEEGCLSYQIMPIQLEQNIVRRAVTKLSLAVKSVPCSKHAIRIIFTSIQYKPLLALSLIFRFFATPSRCYRSWFCLNPRLLKGYFALNYSAFPSAPADKLHVLSMMSESESHALESIRKLLNSSRPLIIVLLRQFFDDYPSLIHEYKALVSGLINSLRGSIVLFRSHPNGPSLSPREIAQVLNIASDKLFDEDSPISFYPVELLIGASKDHVTVLGPESSVWRYISLY